MSAVRPTPAKLKAVIVYDDFAAGERAVRALRGIKNRQDPAGELCAAPWSFDFLADARWRARALRDVTAADLVVLSIGDSAEVPAAIDRWIVSCLTR